MQFYTTKERTLIDIIPFTKEQFIYALNHNKPTEIFNNHYSSTIPCWIITEYIDDAKIKYYANSWANKTPIEETIDNIYSSWCIQGLNQCWFADEL